MKPLLTFLSLFLMLAIGAVLLYQLLVVAPRDFGYSADTLVAQRTVKAGSGSGNATGLTGTLDSQPSTEASLLITEALLEGMGLSKEQLFDRLRTGEVAIPVWNSKGYLLIYRAAGSSPPKPFRRSLPGIAVSVLALAVLYFLYRWAGPLGRFTTIFLIGGLLGPGSLYSQGTSTDAAVPVNAHRAYVSEASIHLYSPPYWATGKFQSLDQVDLSYPEQVFESIMSATSQDWEALHTLGGAELVKPKSAAHYQAVRNRAGSGAGFRLLLKIIWVDPEGIRRALIKFTFTTGEGATPTALYELVRTEEAWQLVMRPVDPGLFFAVVFIKSDLLYQMVVAPEELPPPVRQFRSGLLTDGVFDLKKLGDQYMQLTQDEVANADLLSLLNADPGW